MAFCDKYGGQSDSFSADATNSVSQNGGTTATFVKKKMKQKAKLLHCNHGRDVYQ